MPHIYAAGDVIGFPSLASTSMEQGRIAACHAFGAPMPPAPEYFPYGIYAVPEISTVGLTEAYPATVAAVIVSGLGVAAFHPEGARYANYVSRGQRGRGMSMFSLGGNAGHRVARVPLAPARATLLGCA